MRVVHALGMPGTFPPPQRVSVPDMHHGTCVTHVAWCMAGSLTSDSLWSRWRGKRSRHSRRMRNPQFCVSNKRPMANISTLFLILIGTHSVNGSISQIDSIVCMAVTVSKLRQNKASSASILYPFGKLWNCKCHFQMIIVFFMILFCDIYTLLSNTTFLSISAETLTVYGLIYRRIKEPDLHRPFKVL